MENTRRIIYFLLSIITISVLTIIIASNLTWIIKNPIDVWTILATLFSIHTVLYKYVKKYYLWINHYVFTIFNKSFYWNFSIDFWGDFDEGLLTQLYSELSKIFDNKIKFVDDNSIIGDGFLIQFNIREDQENQNIGIIQKQLHIEIFDSHINYNDLMPILKSKIAKLISLIEKKLKNPNEQLNMTIKFKDKNPYYGFFIQKVNLSQVNNFNVDFYVDQKRQKNYVRVNKKSISISSTSSIDLIQMAEKIMILSNSGA